VHTTEPLLIETKPTATEADYRDQCPKINDGADQSLGEGGVRRRRHPDTYLLLAVPVP
jgi:hypothetical protein